MSSVATEIKTYFGRCRCCRNYGYLKNMWEAHYWEGEKEIYVEMLVQCFALSWDPSEDSMEHDQICESCIKRLRDARSFKKIVLESQEELLGQNYEADNVGLQIEIEDCPSVKPEQTVKIEQDYEVEYHIAESEGTEGMYIDDPDDPAYVDPDDPDDPAYVDPDDPKDMEYEEVEYLEHEDNTVALASERKFQPVRRTKTPAHIPPDKKWPRKLPKSERYKTYKQYTEEDLRRCLEAVRREEMTPQEASEKFNIPRKTICAKSKEQQPDRNKPLDKEKMFKLIKEIQTILTYTNATPFKSKVNRYYCMYCSTDGPFFEEPDALRTHTRTLHATDRTQKIEYALRPYWTNETVKLDIDKLLCTVCSVKISAWNEMFKHLKEQHKIILDQSYTRVIPYVLATELHCALCKEEYTNFLHLDGHMNAHYNNYVCDDCGVTFLAANRLKKHIKKHNVGKFPCSHCSKVFTLKKYKTKHEDLVHKQINKFKCVYCDEKFTGEYIRHVHMLEKHKEKVKIIACEFCGKAFTWRPNYITHKKRKHSADSKKYVCEECGKKFFLQFELREHMLIHTGKKNFACKLCNKQYISSGSLKHHMNWHKKNDGTVIIEEIVET